MRKSGILVGAFLLVGSPNVFKAQETQTIKVKKEQRLAKVVLDNSAYKLVVLDRYGNPTEARLLAFKLYVKLKKDVQVFEGRSNSLSPEMLQFLNSQGRATKVFFTEIEADDNGHLVKLPDLIETWFPPCNNCEPKKSRR